jgi:hypothetical protein
MKVVSFGCGPWRWYRGVVEIHMNKGRLGEERGGKEMDGCPLTNMSSVRQPLMCSHSIRNGITQLSWDASPLHASGKSKTLTEQKEMDADTPNTTQTPEYTKDKM